MKQYKKPPIGASPSWFVLPNRIKDLADAISRFTEHENIDKNPEVTEVMRTWAKEIIGLCDTIDMIRGDRND